MKFNTPMGIIRAVVAPNPLEDAEGPLAGQADYTGRRAEVSPDTPLQDRPRIILHEFAHFWLRWGGLPRTDEHFCDLFARMAESFIVDLTKQGGLDALRLLDMQPEDRFDAATLNTTLAAVKGESLVECGKCRTRIGGASVVVSPPAFDASVSSLTVTLAFYCDGCDHVQVWRELASQSGKPSGAWAGVAEYLTGGARLSFLESHAERYGCVVI